MHTSVNGHLTALRGYIASALGGCPDYLDLDGRIHRFATPDKPKKQNGWYVGHTLPSGHLTCTFGAYHLDLKETFRSWEQAGSAPAPADFASLAAEGEKARAEAARQQHAQHAKATRKAVRLWDAAAATGTSPYLQRKGVGAYGVRFLEGSVLVPMRGPDGALRGVQRLFPDGRKRFGKGTQKKGAFHVIGDPSGAVLIYVAEGYATGASVFEAIGAAVVICFDAGNLAAVVAALRRRYPQAAIVIAADHDAWTPGNPGWSKAEAAALEHGCRVAAPDFSGLETAGQPTDFNDLHQLAGLDTVREQLACAYGLPVELTPDHKRKLSRDLDILASCGPLQGRRIAFEIVTRYIRQVPRKLDLDWLLSEIRSRFKARERDFERVERMARGLEQKLKRQALKAVSIDRERLAKLPNVTVERWTIDDIPRLPEEIIADYEHGERPFVLLKWPMGSGKTTQAMRPIAQHPKLANREKLAVTHRQSLVSDLCCRCGFDDYREIHPADLPATAGLGICINSLANPKFAPFVFNTRVALFDEITQSLREILNPHGTIATRKENRAIWNRSITVMDQSDIVIGCDADLNTLTITALAKALPDRKIRVIEIPENCAGLAAEFGTRRQAWDAIFTTLDKGKRVLIPTDGAREVQKLEALIKKRYPGKRGLAIHSQPGTSTVGTAEVQHLLKNINKGVQELDYLIYSPAVLSGVSLEVPHFDAVVALYCAAVTPSDFVQMLRRDRTAMQFFIGFCGRCSDNLETDPLRILDRLDATHRRVLEAYRDETGKWLKVEPATPFDERVCQAQALEATARNNAANNLLYLLEARGYRVIRSGQGVAETSGLREAKTLQRKSYDTALQTAEDITSEDLEDLKTEYQLTPEQSAAAARYDCKQTLGLAAEDALTEADLELWDQGAVAPKVRRYEAARQPIAAAAQKDADEAEAEMPLSCRKHRLGEAEAIHTAFEALGIDRTTGQGEITAETALDAWRSLKASVVAPALEHFRLGRFARHEPARPVVWASDFLSKFNLTLHSIARPGARGEQQRVYTVTDESWGTMDAVFQRRRSVSSSCVNNIPIAAAGYAAPRSRLESSQ